jgi:hypothetical protein
MLHFDRPYKHTTSAAGTGGCSTYGSGVAEFTGHLRPLVESGTGQERTALAYLAAIKH